MKIIYPAIFTKTENGYVVSMPDFPIDTQGDELVDAVYMARDALGLMGVDMEDDGRPFPLSTPLEDVEHDEGDIVSLVDVDLSDYRRRLEQRSVRRNVTLPSWLNYEAEKAGVNVSAILQEALKERLAV